MLIPASEPTEAVLGRLSPSDRALLELSLRQGVADEDVAALRRAEWGGLGRGRVGLWGGAARQLGLERADEAAAAPREGGGVPVERRRKVGPAAMPAGLTA